MKYRWLVIGGWSISPDILIPLFGRKSVYIDINDYFQNIVAGETLDEKWPEKIIHSLSNFIYDTDIAIAGWSSGAFAAYTLAGIIKPKRLALLSAALSFCKRKNHIYGQEQSVLKVMRRQLKRDNIAVLKGFQKQCGLNEYCDKSEKYSIENLNAGLVFLEHVDLSSYPIPLCPISIFHGKEDEIFPCNSGELMSKKTGSEFYALPGGHVFFNIKENHDFIKNKLKNFG
jgi:surfactin synthase thioesterase subunit